MQARECMWYSHMSPLVQGNHMSCHLTGTARKWHATFGTQVFALEIKSHHCTSKRTALVVLDFIEIVILKRQP